MRLRLLAVFSSLALSIVSLFGCKETQTGHQNIILWAWERRENLEFIDTEKISVAFLAQTITLVGDDAKTNVRHQPLKVLPGCKLIAVTRIETEKRAAKATFTEAQQQEIVRLILKTLELNDVSAIQIDFDATLSERTGYRQFLNKLRAVLPKEISLSITALASWCISDNWISDLPIDEAVPMIFEMGSDEKSVKDYLIGGADWTEPLCRHSYGLSLDEPLKITFRPNRKFFIFKPNPNGWITSDLDRLPEGVEQ